MHNRDEACCRVCGLLQDCEPWGENGKTPSYEICDCCGVEFGYEDSTQESTWRFRKNWIEKGAPWFTMALKPENWSMEEQLKHVPEEFRE